MKVSGPINIVRLEGTINNIHKIVYLFMDIHVPPNIQTECEEVDVLPVKYYIITTLQKYHKIDPHKVFDIFIEVSSKKIKSSSNKSSNYIDSMKQFYLRENKVLSNARIHYIDAREIIFMKSINIIFDIPSVFRDFFDNNIWKSYLAAVQYVLDEINVIYEDIFINKKSNNKIVDKIINSYDNKFIKKKINDIFDIELKENAYNTFKTLNENYNKLKNIYNYLNKNIFTKYDINQIDNILIPDYYIDGLGTYGGLTTKLINEINICTVLISEKLVEIILLDIFGLHIMDMYVLRRLLDKNNITNILIYTGKHHSINCIYRLVKDFNFMVTHASYINEKSIKKVNNIIKNKNNFQEISYLFTPNILHQCSDLSNFPENFS